MRLPVESIAAFHVALLACTGNCVVSSMRVLKIAVAGKTWHPPIVATVDDVVVVLPEPEPELEELLLELLPDELEPDPLPDEEDVPLPELLDPVLPDELPVLEPEPDDDPLDPVPLDELVFAVPDAPDVVAEVGDELPPPPPQAANAITLKAEATARAIRLDRSSCATGSD